MNIKKFLFIIVFLLFVVLVIIILPSFNKETKNDFLSVKVTTSIYPLYFFTSEIAGNKASVSNLIPAGASPHGYEPTIRDIAKIEDSNLLILNGGGLESWGENIKNNINKDKTGIIIAGEGLATKATEKEENDHDHEGVDPHIWLSPMLAIQMVDKITSGLIEVDSNNSLYYKSNAEILKNKLDILNEEFKKGLSICKNKNIVTSHLAFAYLASDYGLKQVSIAGLSTEEEPSSKDMTELVKFVKSNNIKYVFFESLISPKLSETIAKEAGIQTLVLNPIGGLTEKEIKSGKNYFSEMRNNLTNLKTALECKQ